MGKAVVVDEERTINQMVAFIAAEAREKEIEIDQQAQEEHDIEKQRLVDIGKKELLADFESKMRDLEIEKRVTHSKCVRECKLTLAKGNENVLKAIKDILCLKCKELKRDVNLYRRNLAAFIEEAARSVRYDSEVVCLAEDAQIVEEIINEKNDYFREQNVYNYKTNAPITLHLCRTENLTDEKLGGVVLRAKEGKIVCDNSIIHRALICIEDQLPTLRQMLLE